MSDTVVDLCIPLCKGASLLSDQCLFPIHQKNTSLHVLTVLHLNVVKRLLKPFFTIYMRTITLIFHPSQIFIALTHFVLMAHTMLVLEAWLLLVLWDLSFGTFAWCRKLGKA